MPESLTQEQIDAMLSNALSGMNWSPPKESNVVIMTSVHRKVYQRALRP